MSGFVAFIFFTSSAIFASLLLVVSLVLAPRSFGSLAKYEAYECGFKSFAPARQAVILPFFLIAVTFVAFELETIFILPWAVFFLGTNAWTTWYMITFVVLLVLGYAYEILAGLFNWAHTANKGA